MYIFANKGLRMSAPKLAGMVLQAGIRAYSEAVATPEKQKFLGEWLRGGMMKVVLEAEDSEQLRNIMDYLTEHGHATYPVIDEGRTEVRPFSFTTMAVELVDKSLPEVLATFEPFKTYREPKPEPQKVYLRKKGFLFERGWVEIPVPT
jgi:peptidyl-tRNA hydrolase